MKLLFKLFFLLLLQPAFSQNYKEYSALINKAEIAAIDSDFSKALTYYQQAFNANSNIFCKDYYNAAVCAEKENNHQVAAKYILQVIKKGYSVDSIENKEVFSNLVRNSSYQRLNKTERNAVDEQLKYTLDSMFERDQLYRRLNPRNYMNDIYADSVRKIDSSNANLLVNIIIQHGYPNEFSLGISPESLIGFKWEAIFIHQQNGSPFRVVDFSSYMLNAIKNGAIIPHRGAYFYSNARGKDTLFGSASFFKVVDTNGTFKYAYWEHFLPDKEKIINENRLNYNLESLQDYRKKVLYWLKHDDDLIFDFRKGEIINTIDKEIVDKFLKGLTYIE